MSSVSTAERLAKKQREISVSEFFERNKHILGFDSPTRALLTSAKEAVDNALDACQEYGVLPEIMVELERIEDDEYRLVVEDNGPGIVKRQVPKVFGKLLYGSRFHTWSQTRGQQGLGISGAILYGQITTGKPAVIRSKTIRDDVAYEIELMVDTKKNKPQLTREDFVVWDKAHGTRVEVYLRGRYVNGKQSLTEYLRATAIVNPYAEITYRAPDGSLTAFERISTELPREPVEVKPHPHGVELGTLLQMAKETKAIKLSSFLQQEFSRISGRVAKSICRKAELSEDMRPRSLKLASAKRLLSAFQGVKIMAPPTDCLSPIGELLIRKGLRNVVGARRPEFYSPPVTRSPSVHEGHPFQVEVGIVYGGNLPTDQAVDILRYANRVPLLYQQGACACTQAIEAVDWRRYGLEQRGGKGIPYGPAIVLVHVCSTKVPFTSESKEAIAPVPEIVSEIALALKECGRRLKSHMNRKVKRAKTAEKFEIVRTILPRIAEESSRIVDRPVPDIIPTITKIMNVVWIDDKVEYEAGRCRIRVDIHNYTSRGKSFTLHAAVPSRAVDSLMSNPGPTEVRPDGKIAWKLPRIPATKSLTIALELPGLEEGDYDEAELYVSGATPAQFVGVEPLPGDWDLEVDVGEGTELVTEYGAQEEAVGVD